MPRMTTADAAVAILRREGVSCAFGLPGAAINPFYAAMRRDGGIRHTLARHVEGASHMAEGYNARARRLRCRPRQGGRGPGLQGTAGLRAQADGAHVEAARKLMAEYRVPVVVEIILERVTNISMGTELDNVTEFEDLASRREDAPTAAVALLDHRARLTGLD